MENEEKKKFKLKTIWKVIIIITFVLLSLFLYSRFISTSGLVVKEYKVIDNALPVSFYGLKVVHFSDLHYGRTIKQDELDNIVNNINLTKPDIVIFTGDLVDRDKELTSKMKDSLIGELSDIKSTYGNYYVIGNHDKIFKDFDFIMKSSNFISLNGKSDIIYSKSYQKIYLLGINSTISKKPNIDILSNMDKNSFSIMAMHVPDNIKYIKDNGIDLFLAGHSHNGQVRLPIIGALFKPVGAKTYYDEYYNVSGTKLYISSGLGASTINLRFFNKPSFNLYRIVNK